MAALHRGDDDTARQAPPVVPFSNAADVDRILAQFPGPVALPMAGTMTAAWLERTRPIGGIGCGLVVAAAAILPLALLIEAVLGGSREAVFLTAAAIGVGYAVTAARVRRPASVYLVLDQNGFAVRNVILVQSGRWKDVGNFRRAGFVRLSRISFRNSAPAAGEDTLSFFVPHRRGALASLLNQWRERALSRS